MDGTASILREIGKEISHKDKEKTFNLLYKSVGKVDVDDFHTKCDGKGPTLTVLFGKHNTIFGGYTSQDWCLGNRVTKKDEKAFLFYKTDHSKAECIILPIKEDCADRAITCDTTFGPTFGGGVHFWNGYDLQTFKQDSRSKSECKDGYIQLNGTVNYGYYAYKIPKGHSEKIAVELTIKRIEIYQVVDAVLPEPWRTQPKDEEVEEMKRRLEKMEPLPGLDIKTYNILLVGAIGSGKSSLYNTLATVFSGAVRKHAPAMDAPTSVTNKVHDYPLQTENGKTLNLRIFDIRGFDVKRGYEHEFDLILDGKLKSGYSFPDQPVPVPQDKLKIASLKDEIHLVCFVSGPSALDTMTEDLHKRIISIQKSINEKGLPMVVVATKYDDLCQQISEYPERVYTSPKARDATKKVSEFFGIQEKHILPVINYVNDNDVKIGKNKLALQALNAMVELARDYLERHKEMQLKIDSWSKRASKLHIPKNSSEKDIILKKIGAELQQLKDGELRILCVGSVRSGKTSFIDSVSSLLRGEIHDEATGGYVDCTESDGGRLISTTERFEMYRMKYKHHESGDIVDSNLYIGDIPGFQEVEGIKLEDVKQVILGNVPNKYKIIQGISRESSRFKHQPQKKDTVHCVCFVFDISKPADEISEKMHNTVMSLQDWLSHKVPKIPYVVILTKGDELSDMINECKLQVFENMNLKANKEKLIEKFHFRERKIFPVINYVHEDTVLLESDALLIPVVQEILKVGKEYLQKSNDDRRDDSDGEENVSQA